jgi:hypothetical protein
LEYGQLADLVRDLPDHLDAGGAGTDNGDLLTGHLNLFVRPVVGMKRAAFEGLHTLEPRRGGHRKEADRHNDEPACQLAAVVDRQPPQFIRLVEVRRLDLAIN